MPRIALQIGPAHPIALDRHDLSRSRCRQRDREESDASIEVEHLAVGRRGVHDRAHEVRHEESVGLEERSRVTPELAFRYSPPRQNTHRIGHRWIPSVQVTAPGVVDDAPRQPAGRLQPLQQAFFDCAHVADSDPQRPLGAVDALGQLDPLHPGAGAGQGRDC